MEGSQRTNGAVPQNYAHPPQAGSSHQKLRVPTVHEALPYTPLSSIVPFTPEVIPALRAVTTTTNKPILAPEETKKAKRIFEQLASGATAAEAGSKRHQQTIHDLQRLLDPDSLTQFKFKRRKLSHTLNGSAQTIHAETPALSPLAKMTLENTNISYRYITPESPEIKPQIVANGVASTSRKVVAVEINGRAATPPKHPQPTTSSQQSKVEVAIPSSLTPAQRAQYQYVSDTMPIQKPGHYSTHGSKVLSIDQRQKGDQAVQNLNSVLSEIFAAENQLQSDFATGDFSQIFTTRDTDDGPLLTLSHDILMKVDSCISKVISNGRLQDINVEHLVRVQKLCETPVAAVEKLSLSIGEHWTEQDEEEWSLRLGFAESGLVAARSMMRIMTGGAQQKELQSEDFLRETIEALKAVIEGCVVPIVEEPPLSGEKIRGEKNQPPPNPRFVIASSHRKTVVSLLNAASKGMRILGELLVKTAFDATTLSGVEYLCKTLIFAENASTEKDSATGMQNFETMRRCAMDVLAKIFTKYHDERSTIFDEILMSLEKLPATKQSARQYRLLDAKPIQLVSALLMRLVQTSATRSHEALKLRSKVQDEDGNDADDDDDADGESEDSSDDDSEDEDSSEDEDNIKVSPLKSRDSGKKTRGGGKNLGSIAKPLHEAAVENAKYIIKILVQRAAATSKTSDEPYRKLLDIFTEDFLNVLGSSDWPAAELLLRTLTIHMINIINSEKTSVPSRTLALELLGTMAAGILELQIATRAATRAVDPAESSIARTLCDIANNLDAGSADTHGLLVLEGPYRYVLQYLEARNTGEDAQLQTARGYHLMEWAYAITSGREGSTDSDASDTPRASKHLHDMLNNMFSDPKWLDNRTSFSLPGTAEARLASMILTLNSTFCKAFPRMFTTLLNSMSSEQSRVKSKGLASVVSLLEKDASILDRNTNVLNYIFRCATDPSPMVRDSALGLLDKCLATRPALDMMIYSRVVERTRDAAIGVRKRAVKMLKDIYLRNKTHEIRSPIADAIISRIEDTEESVLELARATMEEIWFLPLYGQKLDGERAIEAKLAYASQAALLIETVDRDDNIVQVLESLLKRVLNVSKAAVANAKVCKTLVSVLFDGVIDSNDIPGHPSQDSILRALTIFARSSPEVFTTAQLERLEPYTKNLSNTDDLDIYRSVITILRNAMPVQPTMNTESLKTLQTTLLTSVTKLQKPELREVAPCLWTINNMLGAGGNKDRLPNFIISVLQKIPQVRGNESGMDEKLSAQLAKLMRIAGEFGNACDFGSHLSDFKKKIPQSSGETVPDVVVGTICPLTSPKWPHSIRVAAFEAICTVSQAWPKQFLRADVTNAFEMVFREMSPSLEEVLLGGLEGFFIAQEVPEESDDSPELGGGVATGTERLGKTYVASDQDGASTALAQRFLADFLRIALESCEESSYIAARLVVSINKQGLVHPKDSAPALVALETCPRKAVANEAFKLHKMLHQKHETLFEKEYMRAVQKTFEYQQRVIGDPAGYVGSPPAAKMSLTWEVLKMGKAQIRKKFLGNVAQKLDFDPSKLDIGSAPLQHLLFVKFCLENLAFFEYDKIDDLLHLTSSLEKIFAGTGSTVAQAVESEIYHLQVNALPSSDNIVVNGTSETLAPQPIPVNVDVNRLRQLALAAQILCMIQQTRTFITKLWNLQKHTAKSKHQSKDTNKAANRSTNAQSFTDAYFNDIKSVTSSIDNEDDARRMCREFVDLISVDNEIKVGSEEDAEGDLDDFDTPSESADRRSPSVLASGGGRGRKRKSSMVNIGTPRKKGRPSLGKRRSTSGKFTEDDDDDDNGGGWD